jgi:pimeloyl-ACP methyl ester carboxylesterase
VREITVEANAGRLLHVYDPSPGEDDRLVVFWHHGTPNLGEPPQPLFAAASRRGIRWVSYDRPGYGGSTPFPGRSVASAAADVSRIAEVMEIGRFAVMGHSGGGPPALACGALLPDRVLGAVSISSLAPFQAKGLDWFGGMAAAGAAELHAAIKGRTTLERHLAATDFDPELFTPADHQALAGEWSWLNRIVELGLERGIDGMVDDDLSFLAPWGFELQDLLPPVLILQGGQDRIVPRAHGRWLANQIPGAEIWLQPSAGHISILYSAEAALDWLLGRRE